MVSNALTSRTTTLKRPTVCKSPKDPKCPPLDIKVEVLLATCTQPTAVQTLVTLTTPDQQERYQLDITATVTDGAIAVVPLVTSNLPFAVNVEDFVCPAVLGIKLFVQALDGRCRYEFFYQVTPT